MKRDRPGRVIAGRYELLEMAGEGGMAVVWRAVVRGAGRFARPVAVKRILASKGADPGFIQLFEEEARVGADLQHPNIVAILDFGVDEEGDYFLVMEWVEGVDLHQWVRAQPAGFGVTPWPLVAFLASEVLWGLSAAHERTPAPVFHRDISPSNVLMATNGAVKLSDFGLSRAMDRVTLTRPNVIKGKLAYCAPELISGDAPSARSDLFAVGVLVWEALAQRRLFQGQNDVEVLLAVRRGEITPLTELRHDLPAALVDLVEQTLASEPRDRPPTAAAMARALAAIVKTHPEPVDSEALAASVREARSRLGLPERSLSQAPEPPSPSAPVPTPPEAEPTVEIEVDVQRTSGVPSPVRGLWTDNQD